MRRNEVGIVQSRIRTSEQKNEICVMQSRIVLKEERNLRNVHAEP